MKLALERRVTRRIRSTPGPLVPRFTASVAIADRRFAVPRRFPRRAPTSSRRFLRSGERLRRSRRVSPPPTSPARTRGGGRHTLARSNADRARARAPRPRRARALRASRAARFGRRPRATRAARVARIKRVQSHANRRARGWRAVRERRATVRERPRRPRASPRDASRERPPRGARAAPRRLARRGARAEPRAPPRRVTTAGR